MERDLLVVQIDTSIVSRKTVRSVVESSENQLRQCWDSLISLRESLGGAEIAPSLANLQAIIAEVLFDLDVLYQKIFQTQRRLVGRKGELNNQWFRQTMKNHREYRLILKQVMSLARGLGDSFVWLFYWNEPQKLGKHLAHEAIPHFPTGVGGRGELECIRNIRNIHDQLVLYHSITSMLRVGDATLFDTHHNRVTALMEIKSQQVGPGEIKSYLHTVGSKRMEDILPVEESGQDDKRNSGHTLEPRIVQRLSKQIKSMADVWSVSSEGGEGEIYSAYHMEELEAIALELESKASAVRQVGDGLLLVGFRDAHRGSLWTRIRSSHIRETHNQLSDVTQGAVKLLHKKSQFNELWLSSLDHGVIPFGTPMFWWPVAPTFIEKVYFKEIALVAIYNPAHFLEKLQGLGFNVERIREREFRATKKHGDGEIGLQNVRSLISPIIGHLMNEKAVLESIKTALPIGAQSADAENVDIYMEIIMRHMPISL